MLKLNVLEVVVNEIRDGGIGSSGYHFWRAI